MNEEAEASHVIFALRAYEARLSEIMDAIGDRRSVSAIEKSDLQIKLASLKADIKAAAKRNKVLDNREMQTDMERHYFEPAMRGASANFRVATNSHPINSNWFSCLYSVRIDISYFLFQLEQQYPEA